MGAPASAAPSPVTRFLAGPLRPLIDGAAVRGTGRPIPLRDPSTGRTLGTIEGAGTEEVDRAVGAGRAAMEGAWGAAGPARRARILRRAAALVDERSEELAALEALGVGRPLSRARADVAAAADQLRFFAGMAEGLAAEDRATVRPAGSRVRVVPEPAGVVAAVTPANLPLRLTSWKLAPALAAGCAVVLKPSPEAPLAGLRLAGILEEAGLPPGAFAVVPGDAATGMALVSHPGLDAVSFTGSAAAGRAVAAAAAATPARVTLELGGANAVIVMADADPAAAARGCLLAAFANAGQACSAGPRVLVHRRLHAAIREELIAGARALRAGPALDPATELGPLVSERHAERVLATVRRAVAQGARIATGGARLGGSLSGGFFVAPTVLDGVEDAMDCARREVFGPVVFVQPFDEPDEAVERANAPGDGLVAGVWTADPGAAERAARRLSAGTVWVNCHHRYDAAVPFGGVRASGYGRDSGPEALAQYLAPRAIWIA